MTLSDHDKARLFFDAIEADVSVSGESGQIRLRYGNRPAVVMQKIGDGWAILDRQMGEVKSLGLALKDAWAILEG